MSPARPAAISSGSPPANREPACSLSSRSNSPAASRRLCATRKPAAPSLTRVAAANAHDWPGPAGLQPIAPDQPAQATPPVSWDAPAVTLPETPYYAGARQSPPPPVTGALPVNLPVYLDQIERDFIVRAYEQAKGVKTRTADLLSLKTSALYYKLEKYGLLKPGEKSPPSENEPSSSTP